MTPLEFLAVVLPSPGHGYYCAAELTKKKDHVFVEDVAEFYPTVDTWVSNECDVYFGLASFDEKVALMKGNKDRRIAANARYIRSFFIDMDGYATRKAAATALAGFLAETGLDLFGSPYVISSGGGLHCYWPFEQDVEIADWKPAAENLKRLCAQQRLVIDYTVTADAARVLRIPSTTNFKKKYDKPRPVKIVAEGDTFDFETMAKHIASMLTSTPLAVKATPSTSLTLPGTRPTAATTTAVKLFENTATEFGKIYKETQEGRGCAQLQYYVENATEDGMEPLWRGMMSLAQKCSDGDRAVVWLTELHPYTEDRMRTKLAEIKGPYPCVKFDSENPGVCTSCKHWGKITNPLALGRVTTVDTSEKVVEVIASPTSEEVRKVLRPESPRGYAYGTHGGIFMERQDEDAEGKKITRQIQLLPYDLFPVDILNNAGEHTIHMLALRKDGAQTVTLPQKAVVSKDETVKHLAQQNIIAAFGSGNDKNLFDYIRACVEKMSTEKAPLRVPSNCGWQDNDTFVFAGKIYSTGLPVEVPMPGLENIVSNSQPTGSIEAWREFINLLIRKKLYGHLAIILAGASAPLMRFTGIYGMTYHCGSTESGTGKSLALEGAASVWGHPVHYRTGKGTSPVAMQQRLGLLNSFPLITDEITSKNRADFEWFPAFLLDMTEGRGKERMESGSNKERMNLSTWMTVAIMSSNTHVVDYLTGGRKHASEGELRRLLEFIMDQDLSWEPHEIEIIKSLARNYAVAGHLLADYMAKNVSFLKTMVPEVVRNTYKDFAATNDERFWMAGIGACMAVGIVMNSAHAGVVDFPLEAILSYFKKTVGYMRSNIKSSSRSAEDILNSFTREFYGNFIVVKFGASGGILAEMGNGGAIDASTTRSHVMGRVEHGVVPDHIDYYIEERLLKSFCSSMSFGYSDFKRQLEALFMVTYLPKKDMMAKTKGPQMRVPVIKITRKVEDDELASTLSVE